MKALGSYAKTHYPQSINRFLYGEERTNLINQLRISTNKMFVAQEYQGKEKNHADKEDNSLVQELWIVKDDKQNKQWIFTCIILYDVKISKNI